MLRIAFVEWPESLLTGDAQWGEVRDSVGAARPDILVTNELPFGPWIAEGAAFSEDEAQRSIRAHEEGLAGLIDLTFLPSSRRGLCGTEIGWRMRHSCLRAESPARCTESNIFPTSRDGLKANGTAEILQVSTSRKCWE